jgi:hypothetical protein
VDGKSQVENISGDNKKVVRSVAKEVLLGEHQRLEDIMETITRLS